MTDIIKVHKGNAVFDLIECDESIAADLNDYFAFEVPNARYMNRQKDPMTGKWVQTRRGWDGKIRLFRKQSRKLYVGLRNRLVEFCAERELRLLLPKEDEPSTLKETMIEAAKVVNSLNLPMKPYDFQLKALLTCIHNERRIILSPTGSGKSLIIYMLIRYFMRYTSKKILLLVPTVHLVNQMVSDFEEYGFDALYEDVHLIYEGQNKTAEQQIYISTWQSIYDQPNEYFKQFGMIVCDEVHGATAKSIKHIMENATNAELRFGFTGTLEDLPVHRLQLEGLFGSIEQVAKTMDLVERKILSKPVLKSFTLKYNNKTCKAMKKADYPTEMDFLCNHIQRNNFIQNLVTSKCRGNTLVLFRHIDHGKLLYYNVGQLTNRPTYLIYGKVEADEREEIRQILTREKDAILFGSYGTMSTGSNIKSLRHIVFASPYKSKIKVLQSIGRGTRLDEDKFEFTVWDIADDLSYGNWENHTLKHMANRIEIYAQEGFDYQLINIEVGE